MRANIRYGTYFVVGFFRDAQRRFDCDPGGYPMLVTTNRMLMSLHQKVGLGEHPTVDIIFYNGNHQNLLTRTVSSVDINNKIVYFDK